MSVPSLEDGIGFKFKKPELLQEALTHKSYASEQKLPAFNERLEFLGDSILAAVVAHELFERHPGEDEGRLSKMKALLVSRPSLAKWAADLDLGRYIRMGAGEETTGGRSRPSILANALEALIGAIYLDGGMDAAARFIRRWLRAQDEAPAETDHKSRLQEIIQKKHKVPPQYELTKAVGPDHDKTFQVTVRMGRAVLGTGSGKSKKEAEQAAAEDALAHLARD